MTLFELVLYMENVVPERTTANTILLCTRNIFMLENGCDMWPEAFFDMIERSGRAGIVKE